MPRAGRSNRFAGDIVDLPARVSELSEETLVAVQDLHRGIDQKLRPGHQYITLRQLAQWIGEQLEIDVDDSDGGVVTTPDGDVGRPANIAQVVLGDSAAVVASPGNKRIKITEIRVVNPTATPRQVTIWHDVDGSSFVDATMILPPHQIAPGTIFRDLNTNIVLIGAGRLGAMASAAGTLTMTVYGVEV